MRVIHAICYIVSGIVLLIAASSGAPWYITLIGIGGILYGLKIALIRGSYWVTNWVYIITALAIIYGISVAR
jgi:hypothetical protein